MAECCFASLRLGSRRPGANPAGRDTCLSLLQEFRQLRSAGLGPGTESKGDRDRRSRRSLHPQARQSETSIPCTWKKRAQVPGAAACSFGLLSEQLGVFNQLVLERACRFHRHRLCKARSHRAAASEGEGQEDCSGQGRSVTQAAHDPRGRRAGR